MTESFPVSIEDVRTLVAERQRYDDWIDALDGRRDETSPHVFQRVRDDYVERRASVLEALRAHVSTLSTLGSDLEQKLAILDSSLAELNDQRVEGMLRTAVGEFDTERWDLLRQEVDVQIASLDDDRATVMSELNEVRALLANAESSPKDLDPEPEADGESDTENVLAHVADFAADDDDAVQADLNETSHAAHHELQDDESDVVSSAGAAGYADSTDSADSYDDSEDSLDIDDALSIFSPVSSSTNPNENSWNANSTDGKDSVERAESGSDQATGNSASPNGKGENFAANDSDIFDDLAFLQSVTDANRGSTPLQSGAQQTSATAQKTLRCTECGTMNLPTEWYCERCGGELATF